MTTKTTTYSLTIDANGNWAVMRCEGSHTALMPRRFPHRRLNEARKYLAEVSN
jgi:hypothetical protein